MKKFIPFLIVLCSTLLALISLLSCVEDETPFFQDVFEQKLKKSNRCKVTININALVKKIYENGTSYEYPLDLGAGFHAATGSFTGNTFVGSWNVNYDNGALNYSGTVSVTISEEPNKIIKVTWIEDCKSYVENDLKLASTYSFYGYNIPYLENDAFLYQISGNKACDQISDVIFFEHDYEYSTHVTLVSYSCGETEYVRIIFWEE